MLNKNYYFYIAFLMASMKLCFSPLTTGDLYIWVAHGLEIIKHGSINFFDSSTLHSLGVISYPSNLSSVLYAVIFNLFGSLGLFVFFRVFLLCYLFFLLSKIKRWDNINLKGVIFVALALNGILFQLDRSSILIIPIAHYLIEIVDRSWSHKLNWKKIFILFMLVALWTNLHPSSLILLPLISYKLIIDLFCKRSIVSGFTILILSIMGILSTPLGFHIFQFSMETMVTSQMRGVSEWSSLFSFKYVEHSLLFISVILFFIYSVVKRGSFKVFSKSIFPVLMIAGLLSVRNIIWFFLFIPYLVNRYELFCDTNSNTGKPSSSARYVLFLLIFINISLLISNFSNNSAIDHMAPVSMIPELKKMDNRRILNSSDYGGFITLFTPSSSKIFIDNRNIIFKRSVYLDYLSFLEGEGVEMLLAKYSIDTIILQKPLTSQLDHKLRHGKIFKILKETASFLIYIRT